MNENLQNNQVRFPSNAGYHQQYLPQLPPNVAPPVPYYGPGVTPHIMAPQTGSYGYSPNPHQQVQLMYPMPAANAMEGQQFAFYQQTIGGYPPMTMNAQQMPQYTYQAQGQQHGVMQQLIQNPAMVATTAVPRPSMGHPPPQVFSSISQSQLAPAHAQPSPQIMQQHLLASQQQMAVQHPGGFIMPPNGTLFQAQQQPNYSQFQQQIASQQMHPQQIHPQQQQQQFVVTPNNNAEYTKSQMMIHQPQYPTQGQPMSMVQPPVPPAAPSIHVPAETPPQPNVSTASMPPTQQSALPSQPRPRNILEIIDPATGANVMGGSSSTTEKVKQDESAVNHTEPSVISNGVGQTEAAKPLEELVVTYPTEKPEPVDSTPLTEDDEVLDQPVAPSDSTEDVKAVNSSPPLEEVSAAVGESVGMEKAVFMLPGTEDAMDSSVSPVSQPEVEEEAEEQSPVVEPVEMMLAAEKAAVVVSSKPAVQHYRYTINELVHISHLPVCHQMPPDLPPSICSAQSNNFAAQASFEFLKDQKRLQNIMSNVKGDRGSNYESMSNSRSFSKSMTAQRRPGHPEMKVITLPQRDIAFREATSSYTPQFKSNAAITEDARLERDIKCLLNKLTPENFDRICEQIQQLNIRTLDDMVQLCVLIFDKATREKTYTPTFAQLCYELKEKIYVMDEQGKLIYFKNPVIRFCQNLFETQISDHLTKEEKILDEEIESEPDERTKLILQGNKMDKLKRKEEQYYGNMRFIGELIKLGVLKPPVFFHCVKQLLNESVYALDCLCELYFTVGFMVDYSSPKPDQRNVEVFEFINHMSKNPNLESRVRCKLLDLLEMRQRGWKRRELQEKLQSGPRKLQQMREMAMQEQWAKEDAMKKEQKRGGYNSQRSYNSNQNQGVPSLLSNMGTSIPGGGMTLSRSNTNRNVQQQLNPYNLVMTEKSNNTQCMITGPQRQSWELGSGVRGQDVRLSMAQSASDSNFQHRPASFRTQSPVSSMQRMQPQLSVSSSHGTGSTSAENTGRNTPTLPTSSSSVASSAHRHTVNTTTTTTAHVLAAPSTIAPLSHSSNISAFSSTASFRGSPAASNLTESSSLSSSVHKLPVASSEDSCNDRKPLSPEKLLLKCESSYREYVSCGCIDESIKQLHADDRKSLVDMVITTSMDEIAKTARFKAGEFLRLLLEQEALQAADLSKGFSLLFEKAEDLLPDNPDFWKYLGEVLNACVVDEKSRLNFLLDIPQLPNEFVTQSLPYMLREAAKRLSESVVGHVFRNSGLCWSRLLPQHPDISVLLEKESILFTLGEPAMPAKTLHRAISSDHEVTSGRRSSSPTLSHNLTRAASPTPADSSTRSTGPSERSSPSLYVTKPPST